MTKHELKAKIRDTKYELLRSIQSVVEQAPEKRIELDNDPWFDERGDRHETDIVAVYIEQGNCYIERVDRWADDYLSELSLAELATIIEEL